MQYSSSSRGDGTGETPVVHVVIPVGESTERTQRVVPPSKNVNVFKLKKIFIVFDVFEFPFFCISSYFDVTRVDIYYVYVGVSFYDTLVEFLSSSRNTCLYPFPSPITTIHSFDHALS